MDRTAPSYDELLELTRRQSRLFDELRAEVDRLKWVLEESRRAGKRQAAPFSKGPPKSDPKRPGRKPGHEGRHRAAPPPEQVDRTVEVSLTEDCPRCGSYLGSPSVVVHDQYQIDLPEPKPVITRFRVPVAICPACRARVQGRNPEQTFDALGAAAVLRTCRRRGRDILRVLAELLRRGPGHTITFLHTRAPMPSATTPG